MSEPHPYCGDYGCAVCYPRGAASRSEQSAAPSTVVARRPSECTVCGMQWATMPTGAKCPNDGGALRLGFWRVPASRSEQNAVVFAETGAAEPYYQGVDVLDIYVDGGQEIPAAEAAQSPQEALPWNAFRCGRCGSVGTIGLACRKCTPPTGAAGPFVSADAAPSPQVGAARAGESEGLGLPPPPPRGGEWWHADRLAHWECPRCRAGYDAGAGLVCEGDQGKCHPAASTKAHGTPAEPCEEARCLRCGWGGTLPAHTGRSVSGRPPAAVASADPELAKLRVLVDFGDSPRLDADGLVTITMSIEEYRAARSALSRLAGQSATANENASVGGAPPRTPTEE